MYVAPESKILMSLAVAAGASGEPEVTTTAYNGGSVETPDEGFGD